MIFLVRELEYAGNKHQILQLSDIWNILQIKQDRIRDASILHNSQINFEKRTYKVQSIFQFQYLNAKRFQIVPHTWSGSRGEILHEGHLSQMINFSLCYVTSLHTTLSTNLYMLHLLRSDLQGKSGHEGLNVSKENVIEFVPGDVLMCLNLLSYLKVLSAKSVRE